MESVSEICKSNYKVVIQHLDPILQCTRNAVSEAQQNKENSDAKEITKFALQFWLELCALEYQIEQELKEDDEDDEEECNSNMNDMMKMKDKDKSQQNEILNNFSYSNKAAPTLLEIIFSVIQLKDEDFDPENDDGSLYYVAFQLVENLSLKMRDSLSAH
ncbi:MAG: hypothetical protein EZS28_035158 [Streblomastix strix]|uniref:Uncharacterized protein n=1 Tax=Streblomastix strix TaxID=222440 RepID=A0A5J4UIA6_9EUKA|nr:MAG: hypothetical protein EZS28_035158 [Streblomastix strix]